MINENILKAIKEILQVECSLLLYSGKLTKANISQKVTKEIEDKVPTLIKKKILSMSSLMNFIVDLLPKVVTLLL
mgnify:CR=1 FL=1